MTCHYEPRNLTSGRALHSFPCRGALGHGGQKWPAACDSFLLRFRRQHFYFVVDEKPKRQTGKPLKRIRNMLENSQVSLVIDDYSDDWTQLAYVLVTGSAQLVEDESEYDAALTLLRGRYPQYRVMPLSFPHNTIVRIEPQKVLAWGRVE